MRAVRACSYIAMVFIVSCRHAEAPAGLELRAYDLDYVRVYGYTKIQDKDHTVAVQDRKGKTWYRSPEPALNLADFRVKEAFVTKSLDGDIYVTLSVREASAPRLKSWSEEHVGKYAGVVVDGTLVNVVPIQAPIRSLFRIRFDNINDADLHAKRIRLVHPLTESDVGGTDLGRSAFSQ